MDATVITYLLYLALSVALCVWVGRTVFVGARPFLVDVFRDDTELADSVNRLLIVGFYLVNMGYVSLNLKLGTQVVGARDSIEALSFKIGLVLLVLGSMHFVNLYILASLRRNANLHRAPPPLAPDKVLGGAA